MRDGEIVNPSFPGLHGTVLRRRAASAIAGAARLVNRLFPRYASRPPTHTKRIIVLSRNHSQFAQLP
jgi:hypothetical protein